MKQKSGVDSMDGSIFSFQRIFNLCVIIVRMAILQFVEGPELASQETGEQKHFPLQPIRGPSSMHPAPS